MDMDSSENRSSSAHDDRPIMVGIMSPPMAATPASPRQQQQQQQQATQQQAPPPQHADSQLTASSSDSADNINNNGNNNNGNNNTARRGLRASSTSASSDDAVKVAVRIRPLLPLERQEPCLTILDEPASDQQQQQDDDDNIYAQEAATSVRVGGRRSGVTYTFDCVYGAATSQARLYQHSVVPLLNACLEGYNATILAYGQTGSGKTHTILGNHVTGDVQGVLPRTIHALFDALRAQSTSNQYDPHGDANKENPTQSTATDATDRPCDVWKVQVQFLEIYGEDIRDLLRIGGGGGEDAGGTSSSSGHHHHQSGSSSSVLKVTIRDALSTEEPEVLGVNQPRVYSAAEALQILQTGRLRRVTAATAMNATSSRSHALFTILVEQEWKGSGGANGGSGGGGAVGASARGGANLIRRSKFHFVDLAGSERAKRTQAVGQRLKEGIEINKGLLVLGNVIAALASSSKTNKPFVPYRDSKLTRLLRGSLGGNHKTLMIACVSPSADNLEESLNCLRYANRAKQIQNKATINLDPTSQFIQTLQQHITKLAQQALYHEMTTLSIPSSTSASGNKEASYYTKEQLQALAGGESVEAVMAGVQMPDSSGGGGGGRGGNALSRSAPNMSSATSAGGGGTLASPPRPIRRRESLSKDSAEESLYWQKAQSSMQQMTASGGDGQDSAADVTMEKMVEYEREIGELKKLLAVERSQRAMIQEEQSWMEEVQQSLQEDRSRLERLQDNYVNDKEKDNDDDENSGLVRIEAEEDAEQAALKSWTKKYAQEEDGNDDDGDEDNDDDDSGAGDEDENDGEDAAEKSVSASTASPAKHRDIQENLMDLARSIAAKEELIVQLKASQERYEAMRDFYESKLKEMEASLEEKESERETLLRKLDDAQKLKAGGIKSQELKEKLRQKEAHIAMLRKKSVELRNLTAVSSRNANEISRLTRDVEDMKRRKVDLQKQLAVERKNHTSQVRQLQKEALQKDRELTKYKRLTSKKEMEAEKATRVAKSRLAELGTLRQKYKDTEKKLRVQSVRRGVMAKAGLDPVLVGHRDKKGGSRQQINIDTNALRDLFDEKVSKVARKEALVNKLAEEWEQHFQLTLQRDEVAAAETSENSSPEDLENIELQLKYKEDRIRNLAKRLEKEKASSAGVEDNASTNARSSSEKESFLFDAQFERVCNAAPSDVAHKSLAKVLFGMVVRERRRVAALARTACSLDEKLQSTVEDLEAKDLALRSYVDEQRVQVAEMSQNQQNQILSLMELVAKDEQGGAASGAQPDQNAQAQFHQSSAEFDETLLVLANERISLLEKQLESVESEAESGRAYRAELDSTKESLKKSQDENKALEDQLEKTNAEMLKIKRMLAKVQGRGADISRVVATVDSALALEAAAGKAKSENPTRKASPLPSAIKDAIDLDESDAEDTHTSGGEPEWANEIMDDLALIAEGKVPPSLQGAPGFDEKSEMAPVFKRLHDPENYTGTQKQVQMRNKSRPKGRVTPPAPVETSSHGSEKEDRPAANSNKDVLRRRPSVNREKPEEEATRTSRPKEKQPVAAAAGARSRPQAASARAKPHHQPAAVRKTRVSSHAPRRDENTAAVTKTPGRDNNNPRSSHNTNNNNNNNDGSVFDRLSHQSTFAYANRQGGIPDEDPPQHQPQHHHHQQQARTTSVDALLEEVLGSSPYNGHSSPDVFERLTKTTTEAYAMKMNRSSRTGEE